MDAFSLILAVLAITLVIECLRSNKTNSKEKKIMAAINNLEDAVVALQAKTGELTVAVDRVVAAADPTLQTRIEKAASDVSAVSVAVDGLKAKIETVSPAV